MSVYIEVQEVGTHFGCCAVIRRIGSRRKLASTDTVRPYGFASSAYRDGEREAARRGWTVVHEAA